MDARTLCIGTAGWFFLGSMMFWSIPAEALPIGGHPDKCKGGVPDGAFSCANSGGTVACTNDGDYMCCKKNAQGGQDCEQIEAMKGGVQGNFGRLPGGQLQVAPANPAPKTSPFQKPGMNAPIMRRGVEGEQPTSSEKEGK